MTATLDELTDLRYRGVSRSPVYPGGPAAIARHRAYLEQGLERGALRVMRHGDELAAFTLEWSGEGPGGEGESRDLVIHRRESPATLDWLRQVLSEAAPGWPAHLQVAVPTWDTALRALLEELGLGIQSVLLTGRVDQALARLVEARDPPRDLTHLGLTIAEAAPDHAEGVVALRRQVFTAEPQYCWFGALPGFLEAARAGLSDPEFHGERRVILDGERVVGFLSCTYSDDDPHHGRSGGMDLILDASIRGRGVSIVAYRLLLETMAAHGTLWIKGTTAQPPVFHLGRLMGRQPYIVTLSGRGFFPPGWFDAIL